MRHFIYRRKGGGASITISLSKSEMDTLRNSADSAVKNRLLALEILELLKSPYRLRPKRPTQAGREE